MKLYCSYKFAGLLLITSVLVAGCDHAPTSPLKTEVVDLDVTTQVKMALMNDPALKNLNIDILTTNGDVRLVGVVETQSQMDTAVTLAKGAAGVHTVHNELTIKPE